MQKKLIAVAVAAAVAAPMAASAAPTIYGKLHSSFDYIDDDDDGDGNDFVSGAFRASRLGFKGSESLGGSLKAIWQVEAQINTADNSDAGGDFDLRNTFVGLSGNWGTVLMGRHDTPYKIATGKLDSMDDRISDYNNIIGSTARSAGPIFDVRAPQTVAYISPNFNGFHAAAAYIEHKFNEEKSTGQFFDCDTKTRFGVAQTEPLGVGRSRNFETRAECDNDDENRAWSFMGMWESGNWFVSGAYERQEGDAFRAITGSPTELEGPDALGRFKSTRGDNYIHAGKVGIGWKPGNWRLAAVGEYIDDDYDDSSNNRVAGYGSVGYKFGKNIVKVAVGAAGDSDARDCNLISAVNPRGRGTCDDGAVNYSIALDHNFSKRTTIYAAFSYMDNDDDALYGLSAGEQIGDGYQAKSDDSAPRAASLGIIHKF